MIVGDMGYGAIMLGIVLWIRFKFRDNEVAQMGTSILGPAATMVIAFGFLYGEAFGDLLGVHYLNLIQGVEIFGIELPFHRTVLVEAFMLIAIAVGVVHVLLGLVMGVINAIRTKHRKHLFEKSGILTFIVAIAIAVGLGFVAENWGTWGTGLQIAFAALAFAGFIFAIYGGGIMGVVETVESVAHMASYIRIMAVGLAGAIFADAINAIVADIGFVGLAVVVAVLLHSLNFVICAFSPTIHALRLNFLEFFGKFYETGNKKYDPFTKTGGEEST
jgi:V/A-type H+-transporting ATPase subunit I